MLYGCGVGFDGTTTQEEITMDRSTTIQDAIVEFLDSLSDPATRFVVEGWAMKDRWNPPLAHDMVRHPVPAWESCANDSSHGKAYCYGPEDEGLCLACSSWWIENNREPERWISIEVAA